MNKDEAKTILSDLLARYRTLPYERLAELIGSVEIREVPGASGVTYQLEFQFFWDDQPAGHIRVAGAIDDGGLRAFAPLCDDFIKAPDGAFIGE